MPSKNRAQHGLMAMASSASGRRKLEAEGKKPLPEGVAKEYLRADRGRRFPRVKR